ncbi:MAG: apolipoprotein N-acyltransferase [Actinomycetia bacterium]|nr:apolipoprotein N-acyltransferase [Actinomycetes bacterium]
MPKVASLALRVVGAALAGWLLALAYPLPSQWWWAPISIAIFTGLAWNSNKKTAALIGFVFGLAAFRLQHNWLIVVGTDATWILSVYLALWIALIGIVVSISSRAIARRSIPWPVGLMAIAAIWILEEFLRGRYPFGGYPWARIAFSQADSPLAFWSRLGGVPWLSFMVVVIAIATVGIFVISARRVKVALALLIAASFVVPMALSNFSESQSSQAENAIAIGVVQGGTPQIGLGAMDVRRAVLENHVEQTIELAQRVQRGEVQQPDVVIWPENSSDLDPFKDADAAVLIDQAAKAIGVPILVGAVVDSATDPQNEVYNMGIMWDPISGPGDTYIKNAPVPFGEFIPFRSILTQLISRYERVPRDFAHGTEPGIFTINGVILGDLICFEVAVDPVVNTVISEGAQVLVVQTNNATYAGSALPEQQLNIERLRAIEYDRTMIVAATTGISAHILPDGSVNPILKDGEVGSFVVAVTPQTNLTPAARFGPFVELLLCAIAVGTLAFIPIRRRRGINS